MIQDHPFMPSAHPDDTGDVCVYGVLAPGSESQVIHCGKGVEDHEDAQIFYKRANPTFDFGRTYYLAGPMSGYEHYNYPAFEDAVRVLRQTGIKVESPHENQWPEDHANMPEGKLWDIMMELGTAQMNRCQGIILLKGGPQSRGARRELSYALEQGWPVHYFHDYQMVNMNKLED